MLTGTAFLIGASLLGIGVVRRLPPLRRWLNHVEQATWGMVVGWMLTTLGAYLIARMLGRLSFGPMLGFTVGVWIAAAVLLIPTLRRIRRQGLVLKTLWRSEYAGLALVVALFAPIYLWLFSTHMLEPGAEGVYSGGSTWYDLPFHLAITTSFLYGQNFPPIYTPFPPAPLLYPFMPDFMTALLVSLGMSLRAALISTSVALALAITALFYSLAERMLKTADAGLANEPGTEEPSPASFRLSAIISKGSAAAVLATILFLLNGGLGFFYFLEDWRLSRKSFGELWTRLEANYANMDLRAIHWTNLISDTFLPQRASLFGIPAALMILTLFVVLWQRWSAEEQASKEQRSAWDRWQMLLPAGVIAGLLPAFHPHTFMAMGLVSGFLFLIRPRRAWLAFWIPALVVAAPSLFGLAGHVSSGTFMRFQPGWRGHDETSWLLYWFRNLGMPLLLIFPAWWQAPRPWRRFYLAFVCLMIFSLLVVVSPNDYDNIKLMYYWYAISCILIAAWLIRLATVHRQRFLAFLLVITSIASGLLALQFENVNHKLLFSRDEMDAANYVRASTAPRVLFLTAPANHQPVLSLAGRPVVRGEAAWLRTHGYELGQREGDVKAIYAGSPDALELLLYYRIAFVYLSQTEKSAFPVNQRFFDETFPVFYRNPSLVIYDARAHTGGDSSAGLPGAGKPREFASRLEKDPYQLLIQFPRASYALYRYYSVAFGRMPRFQEFMTDMQTIGRGVYVSAPGWQQVLEKNKLELTDSWTSRTDFKSLYDAVTDEDYVARLYANIGVVPSSSEREALVVALRSQTQTRAAVLRSVAENSQLHKREYNEAFVLVHYFGYLRRSPDEPPDNNLEGFRFWVDNLDAAGDYKNITGAFIGSGEYESRGRKEFGDSSDPARQP